MQPLRLPGRRTRTWVCGGRAEVRNLAQRSASAAKEIKALIQDSVGKVQNGTELVNRSGAPSVRLLPALNA